MRSLLSIVLILAASSAFAQDVRNPQTDASQLSTGTLPAGRMPALTGDVTTSAGAVATAIGATKVTNAMLNADVFSTAHIWATTQTFTVAPVFTNQSTSRTALGLGTASTAATGTSGTTIPFLDGTNTWTNLQTYSSGVNIAGGSFGAGTIYKSATQGLSMGLITGSSNDLAVFGPGGAGPIITVPTGSTNVSFVASIIAGLTNVATTSAVCFNTSNGLVSYDGTIGTCTVSDERLKNMGGRIPNALGRLLAINGVYYTWKDESNGVGRQIGIGAQTAERAFPELVQTDSAGKKSLDYQRLTAPIIEAMRELKADNDNLRECQASWKCRLFNIRSN